MTSERATADEISSRDKVDERAKVSCVRVLFRVRLRQLRLQLPAESDESCQTCPTHTYKTILELFPNRSFSVDESAKVDNRAKVDGLVPHTCSMSTGDGFVRVLFRVRFRQLRFQLPAESQS